MKVMVFDVPDAVITNLIERLAPTDYAAMEREHLGDPDKGTGIYHPDNQPKPPTQGIVAGMGEQASVMAPKAPPMGVLRMVKLAAHPWFQEYAAAVASPKTKEAAGGDSLKLAQLHFGDVVMGHRPLQDWDAQCDSHLKEIVRDYELWATKKGYDLAQA